MPAKKRQHETKIKKRVVIESSEVEGEMEDEVLELRDAAAGGAESAAPEWQSELSDFTPEVDGGGVFGEDSDQGNRSEADFPVLQDEEVDMGEGDWTDNGAYNMDDDNYLRGSSDVSHLHFVTKCQS